MRTIISIAVYFLLLTCPLRAQNSSSRRAVDSLLMREEFHKAIDTCSKILEYDTLDASIYYKMGVAWQNIMEDNKATSCFEKAAAIDSTNPVYRLRLAKSYYNNDKLKLAEPLLEKLCLSDTMNWSYAFFLTSIYMKSERYNEALKVYGRFLQSDSSNCTYLDKTAFVYLRTGNFQNAIDLLNRSLSINHNNLNAIKNLSYLYASTSRWDTAVAILSTGMKIDSSDMDLYARRAQLYYSKDYTKRAMDDYLVILSSGDSSKLYLKRVGIGYSYNLQPQKAIPYLLLAYRADTTDFETCSYLGQCYIRTGDSKKSILYYKKAAKILYPFHIQLAYTYLQCSSSLSAEGSNVEAIEYLSKAYAIDNNMSYLMTIANLYDEKLGDKKNAVIYYRRFIDRLKDPLNKDQFLNSPFPPEYIEKVIKRLEYLEKENAAKK